jgi:hypothetical protein
MPAPEVAWPFLIGRTRTEDHRFVVIPAFMTAAPLASALRASTDGAAAGPESAMLREIHVPSQQPVSAVYRVRTAHAEDYGLPEHGLLTDEYGRPILFTEGLVLRCPASAVMEAGVPRAALEQAHNLVTPAYQAFWVEGSQFARQSGEAFSLTPNDLSEPQLQLQITTPAASVTAAAPESNTLYSLGKHGSRVRIMIVLAIAAIVALLVVVAAVVVFR